MVKTKLYLVGSLRNSRIPELAKSLRQQLPDVEVFDDWYAAGPEADDFWKSYEQDRGRTYEEALEGYAAKHVFAFDKHHLDTSSHVILVLPAGKSGHMELMYAQYGASKHTAILLDPEDVRWDVMYQFIPDILREEKDVVAWINRTTVAAVNQDFRGRGLKYGNRVDSLIARERLAKAGVPDGGWPVGLLSECVGRDRQTLKASRGQASSGGAAALGEREVDGSQKQDSPASGGLREVRRGRQPTFHWLGVEGVG